jgi:hypothetical protein
MHPKKVIKSRGQYISLDWAIFYTGFDQALNANRGRNRQSGRDVTADYTPKIQNKVWSAIRNGWSFGRFARQAMRDIRHGKWLKESEFQWKIKTMTAISAE